jgi:hypothetical protein
MPLLGVLLSRIHFIQILSYRGLVAQFDPIQSSTQFDKNTPLPYRPPLAPEY